MPERVLAGVAASPGVAVGAARVVRPLTALSTAGVPAERRADEAVRAAAALDAAATRLEAVAGGLRAGGRPAEAEIVEAGVLMAHDPLLREAVETAILQRGAPAPVALVEAADTHAAAIASVDDATLAARADDVRSLGRRAARIAAGPAEPDAEPAGADAVLVAADLGPADVAELGGEVRAVALSAGAVTAHAAIVARSLGVPMVVGLGEDLLTAPAGALVVVDGDDGRAVLAPSPERVRDARAAMTARERARERAAADRDLPAVTRDGHAVAVLTNAAAAAEVGAGLAAGAEGAGLIRTELAFLEATGWPTEEDHLRALEPVLAGLHGRVATVRVLDFGGDKTPPFLSGTRSRGLRLMLEHPDALRAQLRAIVRAARDCELRVLLPMVRGPVELLAAREALLEVVDSLPGSRWPRLGAMVETPGGVAAALKLALRSDFLSVGTNDLTHATLGSDRFSESDAVAHHPRVLESIGHTVRAAHDAGIPIEVCGEAASDPVTCPLLIGLGVDELSVGAARVGAVRGWVRSLAQSEVHELAGRATALGGPRQVAALVEPVARSLRLLEGGDAAGERLDSGSGVVAVGPQA
jgi:phosphoenolpyruvate-protein kinase (PTS system EI component)